MNELERSNYCNIPKSIEDKLCKKLHNKKDHPIEIIKNHIYNYFSELEKYKFCAFDNLSPIVKTKDNFDNLLISKDHPARSKSDTYYLNETTVLRTHTSAHQNQLLSEGYKSFLITGDVYRKDEIDSHHYPIFHQMKMLTLIDKNDDPEIELKKILSGLIEFLFPNCEYRFNPDYFPFTNPSFEIEVNFNNKWTEILGCGIVNNKILENNGIIGQKAIACGIGLCRCAMILFNISDIRYLWIEDPKFLDQFKEGINSKFKPYSKLDDITKDISFWISEDKIINDKWINENDFFEFIREKSKNLIENVKLLDKFFHSGKKMNSRTYRFTYSPIDPNYNNPSEFNKLVNSIHNEIRRQLINQKLEIILR